MLIGTEEVELAYEGLVTTGDGERLPLVAWTENAGVDRDEIQPWAVRMARELFQQQAHGDLEGEADDCELLLLVAIDMFVAGLALGRDLV